MTPLPLRGRDRLIAFALATVVLFAAGRQLVPGVTGVFHDDAVYVATAKALASGDGYRLINLPGSPAQRKYPILYPAVLAAIWAVWPTFPGNLVAMQAASTLACAAFFAFSYLYLVRFRYADRRSAAAVVLLCATAPLVLYVATLPLSEMLFALLMVCGLWRLETEVGGARRRRVGHLVTGIVVALPFLCRTIGLALPCAGLMLLAVQRRLRIWTVIGMCAAMVPWLVWIATAPSDGDPGTSAYYTAYLMPWGYVSTITHVVATNTFLFLYSLWSIPLDPVIRAAFGSSAIFWIGFVCLSLATCTAMIRSFFALRPLAWVLIAYLTLTVVWPWPPARFLVPILPLLAGFFASGDVMSGRAWPLTGRVARAVGAAVAAVAIGLNLAVAASHARHNVAFGYPSQATALAPVSWRSFEESFSWIRDNTKPGDILAAGLDPMVFLYTGRQSIRPFRFQPGAWFYDDPIPATGTVDEFMDYLTRYRVSHVVHTPMPGFAEELPFAELILAVRAERPGVLELAYRGRDPRFMVFRVNREH